MKLVVYNKMNALPLGQKSKERTIRFNQSNGVIYISRFLAKEMELKDGDKIIFANDEESKKDWFISKTNDEYGLFCIPVKQVSVSKANLSATPY